MLPWPVSAAGGAPPVASPALPPLPIYSPLHTDIENWIHSGLGQQVDAVINALAGITRLLTAGPDMATAATAVTPAG